MKSKIQMWGNSLALRIPKPFANQAKIYEGSYVDISIEKEKIIISSLRDSEYSLTEILSKINKNNIHDEISYGDPQGEEIW